MLIVAIAIKTIIILTQLLSYSITTTTSNLIALAVEVSFIVNVTTTIVFMVSVFEFTLSIRWLLISNSIMILLVLAVIHFITTSKQADYLPANLTIVVVLTILATSQVYVTALCLVQSLKVLIDSLVLS